MEKAIRHLTVSYINQPAQDAYVRIPAMRLNGKWLESIGFEHGKKVSVEVSDKKLVIMLVEETPLPKKPAPTLSSFTYTITRSRRSAGQFTMIFSK